MWRCPKCGERIDDKFDACWKCGAAQDGTQPADFRDEPNDPATPDLGPEPEPPAKSNAVQDTAERIVDLCSAGNIVEADELCEVLEETGIHARVVGDGLGVTAAGLPLGDEVSPHLWVHENDAPRAREILDHWRLRQTTEPAELPESAELLNGEEPPQGEAPADAEPAALPSDIRFRFLSQGFFLVGMLCILAGAVWAWKNSVALSTYSCRAVGRLHDVDLGHIEWRSLPSERDLPPGPILGGEGSLHYTFDVEYAYVAAGKTYPAFMNVNHAAEAPRQVTICYDPRNPASYIIGVVAPPWMILLFAFLVAALLSYMGYQFR
jgi:hypothetical protein